MDSAIQTTTAKARTASMRCPATDSPVCAGSIRMTIAATTARRVAQCGTRLVVAMFAAVGFVMMGESRVNDAGAATQASGDTLAAHPSLAPQTVAEMNARAIN